MYKLIISMAVFATCFQATAQELSFEEQRHIHNIFANTDSSQVYFSYTYDYYNNWKKDLSGRYFDLEPAPVLRGLVEGVTAAPLDGLVDVSEYEDQAAEFAAHTNLRLEGGRPKFDIEDKDPQAMLNEKYAETHVVESMLSTVVDIPLEDINLSEAFALELAENIDYDHYHFQVSGNLVSKALEDTHISRKTLNEDKDYLLSVFDLREYGCDLMKSGVRDYFSKRPLKDRLANESIYLLSDIKFNDPEGLENAKGFFGRRPDALISQEAMYADHLIRASKMYFAFYREGEKTRLVFLSNLAMGSKFFTGAQGAIIRRNLLHGVGTTAKILNPIESLQGLFEDAQADINRKNACDSGLALGMVKYSQNLFEEFMYIVQDN